MTAAQKALADELYNRIAPQRFATENLVSRDLCERIIAALRSQPGTLAREEVARRDESIDPQGLLDHAMLIEAGDVPAIRAAAILREAAKIMQRFVDTRDMRRAELARLYAIEKSPSHEAGTQPATKKTYLKPFRTIVELDARYADRIRDLLNAAPEAGTQEPVAWRWRYKDSHPGALWAYEARKPKFAAFNTDNITCEPLYAAPQPASVAQAPTYPEPRYVDPANACDDRSTIGAKSQALPNRETSVAQAKPDCGAPLAPSWNVAVEACAKILDEAAADWHRIRDPGMANNAKSYARKIRTLALPSTEGQSGD